jgi:hypothetical protein
MIVITSLNYDGKKSEKNVILIGQKSRAQAKGGRLCYRAPEYATELTYDITLFTPS